MKGGMTCSKWPQAGFEPEPPAVKHTAFAYLCYPVTPNKLILQAKFTAGFVIRVY